MAKKRFLRTGDYKEYIDALFKVATISTVSRRTAVVSGVSFKSDLRTYQVQGEEYLQNLDVIGFQHIACLDWDWPNEGHKTDLCVTIKCYADVKALLEAHGETWRVYITPGGVRAFCISKAYHPEEMPKLQADPLYIELCKKTSTYWARVCPKAERIDYDWVAHYWETIGTKPANEELVGLLDVYHDSLIEELRGYRELSEFQLNMIAAYV